MKTIIVTDLDIIHLVSFIKQHKKNGERPYLVAIDGRSCTGKTTIATLLSKSLNSPSILVDDFYSGGDNKYWRTKSVSDRYDKAIDWKRLERDVLLPLSSGGQALWQPFNWEKGAGLSEHSSTIAPAEYIFIEGTYACRPELKRYYNLTIFFDIPENSRLQRILNRAGDDYDYEYASIWEPVWDYYFGQIAPADQFNLIVTSINEKSQA